MVNHYLYWIFIECIVIDLFVMAIFSCDLWSECKLQTDICTSVGKPGRERLTISCCLFVCNSDFNENIIFICINCDYSSEILLLILTISFVRHIVNSNIYLLLYLGHCFLLFSLSDYRRCTSQAYLVSVCSTIIFLYYISYIIRYLFNENCNSQCL